jgi:hypothetical protein
MASTYSDNLRLELIGSGEQSGAWGNTTNKNLGTLIEEAISGVKSGAAGTIVIPTDANYTLKAYNGVSDEARQAVLEITSTVSLSANRAVIAPAKEKLYVIKNSTTGGKAILLRTTAISTVDLSIPNGATYTVYCDGVSFTQYGGTITHYNNQTGDVFGVSTINADVGIGLTPDTVVGSVTVSNTGVTSFNGSTGAVTATAKTLTDILGYVPIKPDGTTAPGGVDASGNWPINAATATKLASSLGTAPSYATRAWVNYNQKVQVLTNTATFNQAALSTVVNVTGIGGLTTKTGTYTQSSTLKSGTYIQGTKLTGATYTQGSTPITGTYTQSGTSATVILGTALPSALSIGQLIRVTIGSTPHLVRVSTYTDTTHFTYVADSSATVTTPTAISVETAGTLVTVTYSSHGVNTGTNNITVTGGTAVSGAVNVLTTATNTFTYTAGTLLLTSGTMDVTKPSTTVTVTSTAHGLSVGTTSIYVPTISPGVLGAYTATYVDANTFTYVAGTSLLTTYNTPGTLSFATAGTTVTVTSTAHGLIVGESVYMNVTSGGVSSTTYTLLTVPDADHFTFSVGSSTLIYATPGNLDFVNNGFSVGQVVSAPYPSTTTTSFIIQTITGKDSLTLAYTAGAHSKTTYLIKSTVRGSGNISSIADGGTGIGFVNLRAPMQDVNYNVSATSNAANAVYVNTGTFVYGAGGVSSTFVPTVKCVGIQTTVDTEYTYVSITQ